MKIKINTKRTLFEKLHSSMMTNDGYIVSDMFCNPLTAKRHINMAK